MKSLLFIFLIFLSIFAHAEPHAELKPMRILASDPTITLFTNGIDAYQKGDYSQAGQYFKELTEVQPRNEIAYYNWGLAQAKQENWGWSAALFRKALYVSPNFPEARRALNLVLEKLPHASPKETPQGFNGFRNQYLRTWSWHLIFLIIISSLLLSGVTLIKYWAKRKKALDEELPLPAVPYVGLTAAIITLFFTIAASVKSLEFFEERATLIVKSSALRTGPSENDTLLFEIFEGQELQLYRKFESWVQVQVPGGLMGWLPQSDLYLTSESSL